MTRALSPPPNSRLHFARVASPRILRTRACDEKWRPPFIIAVLLIILAYDVGSSARILLKGNRFSFFSSLCKLRPSSFETLSLVAVRKAQSVTANLKMARRRINQACPTPGAMQQMNGIVINSIIHTYCFPPLIRLNSAEANLPLSSEALWMFRREVRRRHITESRGARR